MFKRDAIFENEHVLPGIIVISIAVDVVLSRARPKSVRGFFMGTALLVVTAIVQSILYFNLMQPNIYKILGVDRTGSKELLDSNDSE
jgi:ABC-type Fe3+-siderophore transport system permease subunit